MAYSRRRSSGNRYGSRRTSGSRRTYSTTRRRNSSRSGGNRVRAGTQTLRIVVENQPASPVSRLPGLLTSPRLPKKAPL